MSGLAQNWLWHTYLESHVEYLIEVPVRGFQALSEGLCWQCQAQGAAVSSPRGKHACTNCTCWTASTSLLCWGGKKWCQPRDQHWHQDQAWWQTEDITVPGYIKLITQYYSILSVASILNMTATDLHIPCNNCLDVYPPLCLHLKGFPRRRCIHRGFQR